MNYEDFPILNDSTYSLMREHYNQTLPDYHESIANIFSSINLLINCEIDNLSNYNKIIDLALKKSKIQLNTILSNLSKLFNFNPNSTTHYKTITIFSYLTNLHSTTINLFNLFNQTSKPIIKNSLSKYIILILETTKDLSNNLDKCGIKFFKYM